MNSFFLTLIKGVIQNDVGITEGVIKIYIRLNAI